MMGRWVAQVMWLSIPVTMLFGATVGYAEESFFNSPGRRGWFWYETLPPEPPKPESEPPQSGSQPKPRLTWEDLKRLPLAQVNLDTLPAKWLKALTDAKREYALDEPSPERVQDYIVVQRAVYARSERFADSWQVVMFTTPELDYGSQHPTSQYGHQAEAELVTARDDAQLRTIAQTAGLFFFFTSACEFCREQSKTLRLFADTYGFSVLAISLDGRGLPEFPDANADNGMAQRLEVKMVPMLYLALPDQRVVTPIGAGVLTLSDLKERVLRLALKVPATAPAPLQPAGATVTAERRVP